MINQLTLTAPAKINLFLHILGRRADGYHELQTLFQLLEFGDLLAMSLSDDLQIHIDGEFEDLPAEQNLIYKAAEMIRQRLDKPQGVRIAVTKRLPIGGGLGGGSSDAATTLVGLNLLWNLGLTELELLGIASQLGADVPLFVRGRSAYGEGIGDILTPVELDENWFLLVVPSCRVVTAQIFANEHLTRDTSAIKIARFQALANVEQFLGAEFGNDCEAVVCNLYPEIAEVLSWLSNWVPARMTGTGCCVFAAFSTQQQALKIKQRLPGKWQGMVTRGVSESPLHREIRAAKAKTK